MACTGRGGAPGGGDSQKVSRGIATITIGVLVGGGLGLLVGFLLPGLDNPFVYMAIGIAVGAGASIAFRGWGD